MALEKDLNTIKARQLLEEVLSFIEKQNIVIGVDIYSPDWDGKYSYFAMVNVPQPADQNDIANDVHEYAENNSFSSYIEALKYGIEVAKDYISKQ